METQGKRSEAMQRAVTATIAGASISEAARAYGVTCAGLRYALKQEGIAMRPRGRPKATKTAEDLEVRLRKVRAYQSQRHGFKSHKTDAENMRLLLLMQAGKLTASDVAKAIGSDIAAVQCMHSEAIASGSKLAAALLRERA